MSGLFSKRLKASWPFLAAGLALLLNLLFAQLPDVAGAVYSNWFYPGLTRIVSTASATVSFSLTEVALIAVIAAPLIALYFVFRGRLRFRKWLYVVTSTAALLFAWFSFGWGYNYLRPPLLSSLRIQRATVDSTSFRKTVRLVIQAVNSERIVSVGIDSVAINRSIEAGYLDVAKQLGLDLPRGARPVKQLIFNVVLNKTLTSGFFSPFFHEIHLNRDLLPIEYPFTLAHEKAHQMGFANEAEASFFAWLVCVRSNLPLVRYSGHFAVAQRFLGRSRFAFSDYRELYESVLPEVREDFRLVSERYRRHVGRISTMSTKAYDQYLKANRIQDGVANYGGVVDLVLQWEHAQPLRTRGGE